LIDLYLHTLAKTCISYLVLLVLRKKKLHLCTNVVI